MIALPPQPAPAPQPTPAPVAGARGTWKYTILLILLLAGGSAGHYLYARSQNPLPPSVDELKVLDETLARLFDRN